MPAMTIRKLSETAVEGIKSRAKANGRSAEAEARLVLEATFASPASFKSAWEVIEDFKKARGADIALAPLPRSKEVVEPADFE